MPGAGNASGAGGVGTAAAVMIWIGAVLVLDAVPLSALARLVGVVARSDGVSGLAGGELVRQVLLGIATWVVLATFLRRESPLVRIQTLVVVVLATGVEYTFSPLLHAYTYRLGTVPFYVPPGHGLVYLAALALGRSSLIGTHRRAVIALTVLSGGGWAVWGMAVSTRLDVLGAFWFCCLLGFLVWGPSRTVYLGAFIVVSYLELAGTALGRWTWAASDPVLHVIGQGNPPSGAAGGYGWFDLYALLLSPRLLAGFRKLRVAARARSVGQAAAPVGEG